MAIRIVCPRGTRIATTRAYHVRNDPRPTSADSRATHRASLRYSCVLALRHSSAKVQFATGHVLGYAARSPTPARFSYGTQLNAFALPGHRRSRIEGIEVDTAARGFDFQIQILSFVIVVVSRQSNVGCRQFWQASLANRPFVNVVAQRHHIT